MLGRRLQMDTAGLAAGAQSSETAVTESEGMPIFATSAGRQPSVPAAAEFTALIQEKSVENASRVLGQADALRADGFEYMDTDDIAAQSIARSGQKIPG